jgi:hypothetical protein
MGNGELESFITIPRKVASDYRNRLLTRQERDVYVWLRMIANPYGIATVEFESIAADCFGRGKSANYANRVMLALKGKRYIHYEDRSGRRGSFEVHLGEWPLPRKDKSDHLNIKRLDKYFDDAPKVRGEVHADVTTQSEDTTELRSESQRSEASENDLNATISSLSEKLSVRGHDNDTDTYTEKESDINRSNRTFKNKMPIESFVPSSYEEEQCLVIAKELEEKDMAFILGSMKKYGFLLVEQAWKHCRTAKQFPEARNKGAFFNSILQQFAKGYQGESQTI